MVDKIYSIKNQLIEKVEQDIGERGIDRIDGEMIDAIKDLAEAEKACWEAEYYRSVTKAMDGAERQGYGSQNARSGYGAGSWSSAGYGAQRMADRQGYMGAAGHSNLMAPLREALQNADPDERQHLRNEVLTMMGAM